MKRHCLTLDLQDEPELIQQYEMHHKAVWPGIIASIREAGIVHMELYRWQTRLFMVLEVKDGFDFEAKAVADRSNELVQQWEALMWQYQKSLPGVAAGEKWVRMDKIFEL